MADPPPQAGGKSRGSLEEDPLVLPERPPDVTVETLAEQKAAAEMDVRGESARQRTDISLQSLESRVDIRDQRIAQLINGINFHESPETQSEALKALEDTTVLMLAKVLYYKADLVVSDVFENLGQLQAPIDDVAKALSANDRHIQNAAFHKLSEALGNPDSAVSQHLKLKWKDLVAMARITSKSIAEVKGFDRSQPLKEADRWKPKGFFHEHPTVAKVCILAGAGAALGLIGYGLTRLFSKGDDEDKKEGGEKKEGEKPKGVGGWIKWAVGGVLAAIGLGGILKWTGALEYIETKLGGKAADILALLTGKSPELLRNKALYEFMCKEINAEMGSSVEPAVLADLSDKKYKDIVADDSTFATVRNWVMEADWANSAAHSVGGFLGGNLIPTREKLRQFDAIRSYLKDSKRQEKIAVMRLDMENATLGQVLAKLYENLQKERGLVPAGTTPELVAAAPAAAAILSDEQVEGTAARDKAAETLPADKKSIYEEQKKILREMAQKDEYVKSTDADVLINVGEKVVDKIKGEALKESDKGARDKKLAVAKEIEVKIQQLRLALAKRTQCIHDYQQVVAGNGPEEDFHSAFLLACESNKDVASSYSVLENAISEDHSGVATKLLVGLQLPRAALLYFAVPTHWRSFVKFYWGKRGLPTEMVRHINAHLRRPSAGLNLALLRVEEGESRLKGPLGGGAEGGVGSLEQRAVIGTPAGDQLTTPQKIARQRYDAETRLLEHDKQMLSLEQEADTLRRDIATLKTDPAQSTLLAECEEQLEQKVKQLRKLRIGRIQVERQTLSAASEEVYSRLTIRDRALQKGEWSELEHLATRGAEQDREILATGEEILADLRAAAKRGAPPAEINALRDSFNDVMGKVGEGKKTLLQKLATLIESRCGRAGKVGARVMEAPGRVFAAKDSALDIWRAARTDLSPTDTRRFRRVIARILNLQMKGGMKSIGNSPMLRLLKGVPKIGILSLALVPLAGAAAGAAMKDEKTSTAAAAGQAALDIAPITGTFSDFYTLISGEEMVSKRKVVGYERWLMRPLFGVVGLVSDVALVFGGLGLLGRAGLIAARGGATGVKLARVGAKGAVEVAVKVGEREAAEELAKAGARAVAKEVAVESGEAAARAVGEGGAEVAARLGSEAAAEAAAEGATRGQRLLDLVARMRPVANKLAVGGAIATLGLGLGIPLGIQLREKEQIDVPPAIEAVAGGADGKLDEVDIDQLAAEAEGAE